MSELIRVRLEPPYLLLIGSETDPIYAKTAMGIVQWCPEKVCGQLRFDPSALDLGVPDLSIEEAIDSGARSLVIGVATVGGLLPDGWLSVLKEAASAGLDIVSGMHNRLNDHAGLAEAARRSGARLIDVRVPPAGLPVGTGKKRTGRRILTVAADCAIGKKYAALALHRDMCAAGMNATFRATGQTGIMIAGEGIPIDAVISDFVSGAAEVLSPDNEPDHWDIIEGQGSLFHPGYAGVSLSLLHGSQPDGFVVCHDPSRTALSGWEHYSIATLQECIEVHLEMGRLTHPGIQCVGVSVNTSKLPESERQACLEEITHQTGLPAVDPLIDGCDAIVEYIRQQVED